MIDSNRILTDLLVSFRRIVHRGLTNYSGELWYREGLPSDVFRRLVIRKETETPLDRFSGDYEELITYASFQDLADIIVGNDVLGERLGLLEPQDGASLIDRLYEFEDLRRAAARKCPISEADSEMLARYYEDFREAVKGGKKIASQEPRPTSSKPRDVQEDLESELIPEEETLDSIFSDEASKPTITPGPGRVKFKVASSDMRTVAAEPTSSIDEPDDQKTPITDVSESPKTPTTDVTGTPETPTTDVSEVPDTPTTDVSGTPKTPITDVSTHPNIETDEPQDPLDVYAAIERAIEDGDDAKILRSLHVEVTEIAEGMLKRDPKQGQLVWEMATTSGWFEAKTDGYGLQTLEIFYTLADEYLESHGDGAKASDLKKMLSDAEYSKLLLALREMFIDCRSTV